MSAIAGHVTSAGMSDTSSLPTVRVGLGIVVREGRILIGRRRKGDSFAGLWELPGGKCEAGESPTDCVRRELLEEMNIDVRPVRALAAIEHQYPKAWVILYPFICRHESGEARALSAAEMRWVRPEELPTYEFPPANRGLIEMLSSAGFIDGAIDLAARSA